MAATHRWRGPELLARVQRNVTAALERSAIIIEREIKLQLSKSISPSAPGTPPGAVTGTLRRSVQIDRSQISVGRVRIGPGVVYARIQELGGPIRPKPPNKWLRFRTKDGKWHTVGSVTLAPRPYVRPAAKAGRARVLAQFTPARLLR